jgi:hypothetical protein
MEKAFKKFLLAIGFLLLGGFACHYAHGNQMDSEPAPKFSIIGLGKKVAAFPYQNHESFDFYAQRNGNKFFAEFFIEEEREEESSLKPKLLLDGSLNAVFFYARSIGQAYFEPEKELLPFDPFLHIAPFRRYIRFQVFRI